MDINSVRILITVVSFAVFVAIIAWAMSPSNRARFDRDALIPLNEDKEPGA